MSKIISIHSFRGGTGKSNTTANLTTLRAAEGRGGGGGGADIFSPGIRALFGLDPEEVSPWLQASLCSNCRVGGAAACTTPSAALPRLAAMMAS